MSAVGAFVVLEQKQAAGRSLVGFFRNGFLSTFLMLVAHCAEAGAPGRGAVGAASERLLRPLMLHEADVDIKPNGDVRWDPVVAARTAGLPQTTAPKVPVSHVAADNFEAGAALTEVDSSSAASGGNIAGYLRRDVAMGDFFTESYDRVGGPTWDGKVQVVRPVESSSEQVKLEAAMTECIGSGSSIFTCWRRFGSYGLKRLFSESWADLESAHSLRPDWMKHPGVQSRKLFDLTLPGTHHSGAYALRGERKNRSSYGILTQNLNIREQLMLGIRAFHFNVAWNSMTSTLFASHHVLTLPLSLLLQAIREFLLEHPSELVVLDLSKDHSIMDGNKGSDYMRLLLDEEKDTGRIPGQMVHMEVVSIFGEMLALHRNLVKLPADELIDNPTVSECVSLNMRVFYFWEGQQVVCTDLSQCKRTPGWMQAVTTLPFGPPLPRGLRRASAAIGGNGEDSRVIEPGCIFRFRGTSRPEHPDAVAWEIKANLDSLPDALQRNWPGCLSHAAVASQTKIPPLLYIVDANLMHNRTHMQHHSETMGSSDVFYSRGEGFSIRSEAERLNYLLLLLIMRPGFETLYTSPNIVYFDYPPAIIVGRIINAVQDRKDCGWAIYCRPTGSCWAGSLAQVANNADERPVVECRSEAEVEAELKMRADNALFSGILQMLRSTCLLFIGSVLCLVVSLGALTWLGTGSQLQVWRRDSKTPESDPAIPPLLFVQSTTTHDGLYEIVEGETPNGMPLWRSQDGEKYIFSSTTGCWFIGDEDEREENFATSMSNFGTASPHLGLMPDKVEQGNWRRFDFTEKDWVLEPNIVVNRPVKPLGLAPARTESQQSASLSAAPRSSG
eukprot:CAMPEP_0117463142 /NCGR_PEP_ID=MMETSP0784-20121206/3422_1 /TAXON_ID=39447 /ORGANISM="" /LENGTH=840 /DNA_ID=CAMNT_0005256939 /DNA_START=109 /DNA_END=2628 /DNA_ORIENTATION=+